MIEKLNQGHYKEALDRCICISRIIRKVILTHPVIEQSEQASHLVIGACSEIDAVANLIGLIVKDNDGVIHDRVYMLFEIIIELLIDNPIIKKDHDANVYAKKSAAQLWKLYQYLSI